jgi:hypothetical protein
VRVNVLKDFNSQPSISISRINLCPLQSYLRTAVTLLSTVAGLGRPITKKTVGDKILYFMYCYSEKHHHQNFVSLCVGILSNTTQNFGSLSIGILRNTTTKIVDLYVLVF